MTPHELHMESLHDEFKKALIAQEFRSTRQRLAERAWEIIIADSAEWDRNAEETCPQATARWAVELADALIAELQKGKS